MGHSHGRGRCCQCGHLYARLFVCTSSFERSMDCCICGGIQRYIPRLDYKKSSQTVLYYKTNEAGKRQFHLARSKGFGTMHYHCDMLGDRCTHFIDENHAISEIERYYGLPFPGQEVYLLTKWEDKDKKLAILEGNYSKMSKYLGPEWRYEIDNFFWRHLENRDEIANFRVVKRYLAKKASASGKTEFEILWNTGLSFYDERGNVLEDKVADFIKALSCNSSEARI